MKTGIYDNLSNEEYHRSEGVSKSQLDLIAISPSVYLWNKKAPVDTDKLKAFDMGTALHCLLLEPDEFENRFVFAPEVNRRTKEGRQEEAKFIKENHQAGITIMTHEEHHKLMLMRDSVFAHPVARKLLEAQGHSERSVYWQDKETGVQCRSRFDRQLEDFPIIIDVKKTAQIERFSESIHEYRYHVQSEMYKDAYYNIFGEYPQFLFIAVSETIDGGKYPVRVWELDEDYSRIGHRLYRRDLEIYQHCLETNDWGFAETLSPPHWLTNKEL